jgi:hypothetical protein
MAISPSLPNIQTYPLWQAINEQSNNVEYSLEVCQIQLTAAQLNALKTTPIQFSPTPSIYQAIWVDSLTVRNDYNSVAYTLNAGTLKLYYGPPANALPITADLSGILTQTANSMIVNIPLLVVGPTTFANVQQQPIYLGNTGGANFTLGNSPVTFTMMFGRTTP